MNLLKLHDRLLNLYGPQGWWPVPGRVGETGYNEGGYHPGIFPEPDSSDRFQIISGAILTQNTTWKNARRALEGMISGGITDFSALERIDMNCLAGLITPCGYFNQKAKKLKICGVFIQEGGYLHSGSPPNREDLLGLWGIGPETADSILLYAFGVPVFVIDAYTRRLFRRLEPDIFDDDYHALQKRFQDSLDPDIRIYQEYHALIVRHAKERCKTKPDCEGCRLRRVCSFGREERI